MEVNRKNIQQMEHHFDFMTCQQEIRNLKKSYRLVIDNNRKKGCRWKTCKYYDVLDFILGRRRSFFPSIAYEKGSKECSRPTCSNAEDNKPGENLESAKFQQELLNKENLRTI